MEKIKKYYVYQLISNKNEIFYVGKGSGNRMYKHIEIASGNSINKSRNPKLYNKISKIINEGGYIKPNIIFESHDENLVLIEEIKEINRIGIDNLCNLTIGGEGTSGYKLSEETKQKMSLAKKNQWKIWKSTNKVFSRKKIGNRFKKNHTTNIGRKLSEETKQKMSLAKKGKTFTDEHKRKLSESLTGRKLSKEHIKNIKISKEL